MEARVATVYGRRLALQSLPKRFLWTGKLLLHSNWSPEGWSAVHTEVSSKASVPMLILAYLGGFSCYNPLFTVNLPLFQVSLPN